MRHKSRQQALEFSTPDLWQNEFVRFVILTVLGVVASYLNVNIPYTDVFIEGRWIFGFIGFAILDHWWSAFLLACLLSITTPAGLSITTVLIGNMLYALPDLVIIRTLHRRVLSRWHSLPGYGLVWLLMILACYQFFHTPVVWSVLAVLDNLPIWPAVIEGWLEQPFLLESFLVGIISALALIAGRSNAALRASRRELEHVLATVPEGVLVLDADGKVLLANPIAVDHLALLSNPEPDEAITRLGDSSLEDLLTSPPKGLWHEVRAGTRTFEIIARPVANGPEPEQWVLVIRDVTEERSVRQRAELQDRLAAVGELAAGIAHDFNNIIAVISLYAQMEMRDNKLTPQHRERVEIIEQQAQRAAGLVQQVLDFSRQTALDRRPMDLLLFLKEQVKLLERTIPEDVEIEFTYEDGPCRVSADPTGIQQVMMNLAINARDAMPYGGRLSIELTRVRVEAPKKAPILGMKAGDWVRVTVADTGQGIPANVLPHIFEPFFTTKVAGEGTGLGLAQVWGIIDHHEGFVNIASEEGEGTKVTFYLPALASQEPEKPSKADTDCPKGSEQTILIVEDNPAVRTALVDTLKMLNYCVLTAVNGGEALAVLAEYPKQVELVLSDLVMPVMGGAALFHALKNDYPTIPVILLTGHPMEDELKSMQAQGLSGYLLKPPDTEELARVISRLLIADSA